MCRFEILTRQGYQSLSINSPWNPTIDMFKLGLFIIMMNTKVSKVLKIICVCMILRMKFVCVCEVIYFVYVKSKVM